MSSSHDHSIKNYRGDRLLFRSSACIWYDGNRRYHIHWHLVTAEKLYEPGAGLVPEGIDMETIRSYLGGLPQVSRVHDLHVWGISTTEISLSVHLIITDSDQLPGNFLTQILQQLHDEHGIEHATIHLK